MLRVEPLIVKDAIKLVRELHRRHPSLVGCMWAIALYDDDDLVGAAAVGRPKARLLQDGARVLEVTRVAVLEDIPNGCSKLYGAVSRAAREMGARDLFTYIHNDEMGVSLRAAGWRVELDQKREPRLFGGGSWSRVDRKRDDPEDDGRRQRWWTPWSFTVKSNPFNFR